MSSRDYKLPSGERTTDVDVYCDAWTSLIQPLLDATGWTLLAMNPGYRVHTDDGANGTLSLHVGQVKTLIDAIQSGAGELRAATGALADVAEALDGWPVAKDGTLAGAVRSLRSTYVGLLDLEAQTAQHSDDFAARAARLEMRIRDHVAAWCHIQAALAPDDEAAKLALAVHGNPPLPTDGSLADQVLKALNKLNREK